MASILLNAAQHYYAALSGIGVKAGGAGDSSQIQQLKAELAAVQEQLAATKAELAAAKASGAASIHVEGSAADATPASAEKPKSDEDFDLFADDEDESAHEAEIERRAQEQLARTAAKQAEKGIVMKSAVVIDVKPWDDTTDLDELERLVREIEIDGLEWKAAEKKPIAFGIKKLVISCHIEDAKVSVDDLQERIAAFEDSVQSTDVVTFTKL